MKKMFLAVITCFTIITLLASGCKKGDHFTLECYEHKGLFLNSTLVSQISYTGPKTTLEIHFIEKEQEWFFLKPF